MCSWKSYQAEVVGFEIHENCVNDVVVFLTVVTNNRDWWGMK